MINLKLIIQRQRIVDHISHDSLCEVKNPKIYTDFDKMLDLCMYYIRHSEQWKKRNKLRKK